MGYNVVDIQGIGPVYAEKLVAAGIATVDQLLEKGKTPKGRKDLEDATGITGKLILTWVNHADLCRIKGIGPQFSELLEAARSRRRHRSRTLSSQRCKPRKADDRG